MINFLSSLAQYLPEVESPKRLISIKEKLIWTGVALVIFFLLYNTTAIGVKHTSSHLNFLQIITASKIGSLLTLGIGPIVLASLFLQLFVGAGLISLDLTQQDQRRKFHEAQKVFSILLALFQAFIFVYGGAIILEDTYIDQATGKHYINPFTALLVIFQVTLGTIFIIYLDEIVSRYGIGSGLSLFIAAGVSLSIVGGLYALIFGTAETSPFGSGVIVTIINGGGEAIAQSILILLPFIFTVIIFLIAVYGEGMKIEVPISYSLVRGMQQTIPFKFFYMSVLPVIFASIVLLNVQLLAPPLGKFISSFNIMIGDRNIADYIAYIDSNNQVRDGILYFFTPIYQMGNTFGFWNYMLNATTPIFQIPVWVHALTYLLAITVFSLIFGVFWAETNKMDSQGISEQLAKSNIQIPGHRMDQRLLKKVLERYIDPLIVTSSLSIGFLAGIADLTGALGSGTGILLTVSIFYKFYEDFEKQKIFEIYPQLGSLFGK